MLSQNGTRVVSDLVSNAAIGSSVQHKSSVIASAIKTYLNEQPKMGNNDLTFDVAISILFSFGLLRNLEAVEQVKRQMGPVCLQSQPSTCAYASYMINC